MLTLEVSECVCGGFVTQQDLHNQRKTGHVADPVLRFGREVHTSLTDQKQCREIPVLNLQ